MLTLSILAVSAAVFAIMAVTIGSFAIETRRLRKIAVDYRDAANVEADAHDQAREEIGRLQTELSICRGDFDEADAELKRLQGGRLLR